MKQLLLMIIFSAGTINSLMAKGVGEYSEATDVFEIMDHVTRWDPKLTEVYRKAWEKKYPIDLETKSDFSTYAEIRLKFYEKHKEEPIEYDIS